MSRIIKPLVVSVLLAGSLLSTTTQAAPRVAADGNNKAVVKLQTMVKEITTERDLLKTEKDKLVLDIEKLKKEKSATASDGDRLSSE